MARTPHSSQRSTKAHSGTQNQTTDASDEKPFDPTRSKAEAKVYEDAVADNREHDFRHAILEARRPPDPPKHVPPTMSPAVAEQTRLEMEAGAKRVAQFEAEEAARRATHDANQKDKWADKGSVEVFRPADYVPDQKKGQGNVGGTEAPI